MRAMKRVLVEEFGMLCTVRESRGDDEMAACGQLGSPAKSPRGAVPLAEPPAKFAAALRPLLPAA